MIYHPKRPVNEFDCDFLYFFAVGIYEQSLTSDLVPTIQWAADSKLKKQDVHIFS